MTDNISVVRIESGLHGGVSRPSVNGQQIEVPHGKDVPIHVDYAEALANSNIEFTLVSGAVPKALRGRDAEGGGASPSASIAVNQPDSDRSEIPADRQDAETPDGAKKAEKNDGDGPIAPTPAPATKAPPELAQGSTGHDGRTAEQMEKEPKTTPESGLDNQDAHLKSAGEKAEDKETLAAAADDAARKASEDDGEVDGKPFSSEDTLSGPISKIRENMDEFTPRQLRALIEAEKKGQNRSTLIAALEAKLG